MTVFIRRFSLLLIGALLMTTAGAATPYVVDGDGDQVSDEIDDCPYTHVGVTVDAEGCPLSRDDADLDGVPDDDDECPYSATGAVIDVHGCAIDADFDGVADGIDRCPQTGLALPVDARGCARDETAQAPPAPRVVPPPRRVEPPLVALAAKPMAPSAPVIAVVELPPSAPPMAPQASPVLTAPAAIALPAEPLVIAEPSVAETPEMILRFGHDSVRLGSGDLAAIQGYAKIFARRLATSPASKVRLRAFADQRETGVAALAAARLSAVVQALVQHGVAADRIQADSGLLEGGDAGNNRRVEARLASD